MENKSTFCFGVTFPPYSPEKVCLCICFCMFAFFFLLEKINEIPSLHRNATSTSDLSAPWTAHYKHINKTSTETKYFKYYIKKNLLI